MPITRNTASSGYLANVVASQAIMCFLVSDAARPACRAAGRSTCRSARLRQAFLQRQRGSRLDRRFGSACLRGRWLFRARRLLRRARLLRRNRFFHGRLGRLLGGLATGRLPRLVVLAIAARDGADRAADVVVDMVLEVGERDARRPVRRTEAAAVQQHDAVLLGEAENDVERMHVLLHPRDNVLAEVLARPELEIDQAV